MLDPNAKYQLTSLAFTVRPISDGLFSLDPMHVLNWKRAQLVWEITGVVYKKKKYLDLDTNLRQGADLQLQIKECGILGYLNVAYSLETLCNLKKMGLVLMTDYTDHFA